MQGGRWSPGRFDLAALRDAGPLGRIAAGLFYGARRTALGVPGLSVDCRDDQRVTGVTFVNDTALPVTVRVVGWDAAGNEDATRTYSAVCQPGTTVIPVSTLTGAHVQLQPNGRGGWSGFNTYTG